MKVFTLVALAIALLFLLVVAWMNVTPGYFQYSPCGCGIVKQMTADKANGMYENCKNVTNMCSTSPVGRVVNAVLLSVSVLDYDRYRTSSTIVLTNDGLGDSSFALLDDYYGKRVTVTGTIENLKGLYIHPSQGDLYKLCEQDKLYDLDRKKVTVVGTVKRVEQMNRECSPYSQQACGEVKYTCIEVKEVIDFQK